MFKRVFIAIGMFLIAGCAIRDSNPTPFNNPTNTPIIHDGTGNHPAYCMADAKGHYDGNAVAIQSGMNGDSSAWAQAGGCVLRPIREVWAVLNNLEVMKFDAADRFVATRIVNPSPQFTHEYDITYYKSSGIPISIHWTIQWFHGIGGGTFLAPTSVNINYQRTDGTPFMKIWQGGIVLTKVTDRVTSVALRNEFLAQQSDRENVQSTLDIVNEMIRHMREGQPDWARLNTGLKDNPDQPDPAPPSTVPVDPNKTTSTP